MLRYNEGGPFESYGACSHAAGGSRRQSVDEEAAAASYSDDRHTVGAAVLHRAAATPRRRLLSLLRQTASLQVQPERGTGAAVLWLSHKVTGTSVLTWGWGVGGTNINAPMSWLWGGEGVEGQTSRYQCPDRGRQTRLKQDGELPSTHDAILNRWEKIKYGTVTKKGIHINV